MSSEKLKFFVVTTPGLEEITSSELEVLIRFPKSIQKLDGGLLFEGGLEDCYRVNYLIRTANRVLLRLGSFYTTGFSELIRKTTALNWAPYIIRDLPLSLRVTCKKSKLYHSGAVKERVIEALQSRFDHSLSLYDENTECAEKQLIVVRLYRDKCIISLDTSGVALHKRGYRLASGKAPLREDLAAALILASGWDKQSPLLDPFCGSGTIAIEAAMMASGIAPGQSRGFLFQQFLNFRENIWLDIKNNAKATPKGEFGPILASDRDAGVIESAIENAERAGVSDRIEFENMAVSDVSCPASAGYIVSNLPYGKRVRSNRDLRNLYASFGRQLSQNFRTWQATLLTSDRSMLSQMHLPFDQSLYFDHGGIRVTAARTYIP